MLGKAMGEFRKATDDLKSTIEREVRLEELKKITPMTLESFNTPPESVSRTEPVAESPAPERTETPLAEVAADPLTQPETSSESRPLEDPVTPS